MNKKFIFNFFQWCFLSFVEPKICVNYNVYEVLIWVVFFLWRGVMTMVSIIFSTFLALTFCFVFILGVKARWEVIYPLKSQVPDIKVKLTLVLALEKKMTIYHVIMLIPWQICTNHMTICHKCSLMLLLCRGFKFFSCLELKLIKYSFCDVRGHMWGSVWYQNFFTATKLFFAILFSRYRDFCVLVKSKNFKICDVIISIAD